ncbi:quinone oxidoreductase family protein [Microbulbifer hainanensis]|uniref:quinone oxidoreductase family protein n=1 Tax=Microbulbifer hainanensis TaxID=2735675 RepID=UPI00186653B1|nr:quinone oxidoreductase [Microbulbifer hainanensis]
MKAVIMSSAGEPDVLQYVKQPNSSPGPGEALVEVAAAGVNFMDVGVRQGKFWSEMPNPKTLGVEGSGRVLAVGEGVDDIAPGQRVAWIYAPGSYAEKVLMPAASLVPVPDGIDDRIAAAVMMQGLTASHFATNFYPIQAGDVALVHAAAGGVGQLLTQIIKLKGGSVIGRVSNQDKVSAAKEAGADHVIVDSKGDFTEEVMRITEHRGVDVVFDGSGPTTFRGSIESLRRAGTLCWYGPGFGAPEPIDLFSLPKSIKIGYANFGDHIYSRDLLLAKAAELFDWIANGKLTVQIGGIYPLSEASRAHADIESRATTGKLLLIP